MTGRGVPRLLAAALAAADRGWPVFPLFPGSKRPALSGWPEHATCDPATIEVWWTAAPYNIGIACGPARLLVVDLDGPEGMESFADLTRPAGSGPYRTYTVATPGGEHRYFAVAACRRFRSTVGRLAPQIDTRAGGGYVVAAGSTRRASGRQHYYRLTTPPDLDPVPVPTWLALALTAPSSASMSSGGREERRSARPRSVTDAAVMASEIADAVRTAAHGSRNTTLFMAALRLGRLVAVGVLDEDDVQGQLREAARPHVGTAGFTSAEVERTIANGLRYARRNRL